MSVTFYVHPHRHPQLNLNNRNACDLLTWLGFDLPTLCPDGLVGALPAADLAARCRRRLWEEPRNHDDVLASEPLGPRALLCGRPAGYLRARTADLLLVADAAGPETLVRFD